VAIAKPATASTPASNRFLIRVPPELLLCFPTSQAGQGSCTKVLQTACGSDLGRPSRMDTDSGPPRMFLNQTNTCLLRVTSGGRGSDRGPVYPDSGRGAAMDGNARTKARGRGSENDLSRPRPRHPGPRATPGSARPELLPWRLVHILQQGAASPRRRQAAVRRAWRVSRCNLAAERFKHPQIGTPEQALFPGPVGREGQGRRRVQIAL
jgi:hypothetical protein